MQNKSPHLTMAAIKGVLPNNEGTLYELILCE